MRHTAKSGAKKRQSLSCKCHFQYPLQAITKRQKRQSLSESALGSKVCPKVIFALPSKARVLLQIGPLFKRIGPLFQDMSIQDNTKKKSEKAKSFAVRQSMPCVAYVHGNRACVVRGGAVGNVLQGNALAAYSTLFVSFTLTGL